MVEIVQAINELTKAVGFVGSILIGLGILYFFTR